MNDASKKPIHIHTTDDVCIPQLDNELEPFICEVRVVSNDLRKFVVKYNNEDVGSLLLTKGKISFEGNLDKSAEVLFRLIKEKLEDYFENN